MVSAEPIDLDNACAACGATNTVLAYFPGCGSLLFCEDTETCDAIHDRQNEETLAALGITQDGAS